MGPRFKPTAKQRERVMICKADGMRAQQIARLLGIDVETLSNEFSRELKLGVKIIRQRLLAMATRTAINGSKLAIALVAQMMRQRPAVRGRMPRGTTYGSNSSVS
jgi:DNA-binding CsgD family transcriptional regulator